MKVDSIPGALDGRSVPSPAFALLPIFVLGVTAAAAQAPAAFIQPDPTTKQLPTSAFKITRGGHEIGKESSLQPCDRVDFVATPSGAKRVAITTTRGGKNVVLDNRRPWVEVSCEKVELTEAAAHVWKAISGGDRATSVPVVTKGSRFDLPVLASDRSNLVAGKRALFLTWVGGRPPFHVVLSRITSGEVLAEVWGLADNSVRLPEIDLQPGQYSLGVFNTPDDGSPPGLREDNLFVVEATRLPQPPAAIAGAGLSKAEEELLYGYYLEGLPNGLWTFEAMQREASIQGTLPAAKNWLRSYSESR